MGADFTLPWIRASAQRSSLVDAGGAVSLEDAGTPKARTCPAFISFPEATAARTFQWLTGHLPGKYTEAHASIRPDTMRANARRQCTPKSRRETAGHAEDISRPKGGGPEGPLPDVRRWR